MRCEITSNLIFIALIAMKAIKYNYIEIFFVAFIAMNAIIRRYNSTLRDCYEPFCVSFFVSFVANLQGVLYVLGCACVSVVFYVCVYMCMFKMCVCLVGFLC